MRTDTQSTPSEAALVEPALPTTYRFANCVVDRGTREVRLDGALQPVARKNFELLLYLIDNRTRVVSKAELLDVLWNDLVVTENVVARGVMKAREAIGDVGVGASLIRTIHRVGYRFVAPLLPEHDDDGPLPFAGHDTRFP